MVRRVLWKPLEDRRGLIGERRAETVRECKERSLENPGSSFDMELQERYVPL
jgi:hypothetical protein